ncbi:SDR family NAD(P)-dependent oxidoreductase [Sphingomonas sp.]|uniref:SDR family NAD(P)-dependent oxidoreductase n=1 Tax=Sphingomonas sp. TaxID=28214 RepID=UPI003B002BEC
MAVVTGGSSGIGLATAAKLVEEGASVFIIGRRQEELNRAVGQIGSRASAVQGDVASAGDLDRLYRQIAAQAVGLDIVVANAALSEPEALGAITEDAIDRQLAANVKGVILTVQKALPLLRDGGAIVLVGSIAATKAVPHQSVYAASKAAVRALARTWAVELKDRHIRVNVVSPGPVDTPGTSAVMDEATKAMVAATVPVGRMGRPADIAGIIAMLASDTAAFVNGADYQADGGFGQV